MLSVETNVLKVLYRILFPFPSLNLYIPDHQGFLQFLRHIKCLLSLSPSDRAGAEADTPSYIPI